MTNKIYICAVFMLRVAWFTTQLNMVYMVPVYLRFKLVYLVVGMVNGEVSHTDDDFVQQLFR